MAKSGQKTAEFSNETLSPEAKLTFLPEFQPLVSQGPEGNRSRRFLSRIRQEKAYSSELVNCEVMNSNGK